jgi:hypothetical protein
LRVSGFGPRGSFFGVAFFVALVIG